MYVTLFAYPSLKDVQHLEDSLSSLFVAYTEIESWYVNQNMSQYMCV
jgi:hypothetical protein